MNQIVNRKRFDSAYFAKIITERLVIPTIDGNASIDEPNQLIED